MNKESLNNTQPEQMNTEGSDANVDPGRNDAEFKRNLGKKAIRAALIAMAATSIFSLADTMKKSSQKAPNSPKSATEYDINSNDGGTDDQNSDAAAEELARRIKEEGTNPNSNPWGDDATSMDLTPDMPHDAVQQGQDINMEGVNENPEDQVSWAEEAKTRKTPTPSLSPTPASQDNPEPPKQIPMHHIEGMKTKEELAIEEAKKHTSVQVQRKITPTPPNTAEPTPWTSAVDGPINPSKGPDNSTSYDAPDHTPQSEPMNSNDWEKPGGTEATQPDPTPELPPADHIDGVPNPNRR